MREALDRRRGQLEVTELIGVSLLARHRRLGDVVHLTRRDVMELPSPRHIVCQRRVERPPRLAQECASGGLDSPVRVDLDEHPLGAALDVDALRDPRRDAGSGRRIVPRERAILEPHTGSLAREREGTGDHQ